MLICCVSVDLLQLLEEDQANLKSDLLNVNLHVSLQPSQCSPDQERVNLLIDWGIMDHNGQLNIAVINAYNRFMVDRVYTA